MLPGEDDAVVSPTRVTSDSERVVDGNAYVTEYGANNRPGESSPNGYIIAPGGDDDLAWAHYAIGELSSERPIDISFKVTSVIAPGGDDDLPLTYWIGVSDYTKYRWRWCGPYTGETEVELNSATTRERYVSASEVFHLVVVVDSSGVEPNEDNPDGIAAVEVICSTTDVRLGTDPHYYTTAPHYTMLKGVTVGSGGKGTAELDPETQYVTITWEHITDSANWKNEAMKYEIRRELVNNGKELPLLLGMVPAPGTQFVDPLDVIPGSKHLIPGATYIYRLTSINIGGKTPMSATEPVAIPLFPPTDLEASDGTYPDKIVLTWTKAEGATNYEIYRDNHDEPIEVVGDVDTWEDTAVEDSDTHIYWLKSVNEYATSEHYSAGDIGYLGESGDPS